MYAFFSLHDFLIGKHRGEFPKGLGKNATMIPGRGYGCLIACASCWGQGRWRSVTSSRELVSGSLWARVGINLVTPAQSHHPYPRDSEIVTGNPGVRHITSLNPGAKNGFGPGSKVLPARRKPQGVQDHALLQEGLGSVDPRDSQPLAKLCCLLCYVLCLIPGVPVMPGDSKLPLTSLESPCCHRVA
jgi:hypothetical protein